MKKADLKNNRDYIFESSPVSKAVIKLALPTIIGQMVTLVYNLADTYFIGMTGDANMVAAVSLCSPVFMVMVSAGNLFGVGSASLMSRSLGEKNVDNAKRASALGIYGALTVSAVLTILALTLLTPVANLLGATAPTMQYTKDYIFWTMGIGAVFTILSAVFANIVRSEGFAVASGVGIAIGAILNIVLDPVLILTLKLNVYGAALATTIGNAAATLFFLGFLIVKRKHSVTSFDIRRLKGSFKLLRPLLSVGLPSAFNTLLVGFAMGIMNNLAVKHGEITVAALGIVKKIDLIPWSIVLGLTQGILPLIAYNFAAKNYKRKTEILKFAVASALLVNIVCIVVFEAVPKYICGLFIDNAEVANLAASFLRVYSLSVPFMSIGVMFNITLQAMGRGARSLILAICRQGLFYVPILYIGEYLFASFGIVWAQVFADFLFAALGFTLYFTFMKKLKKSETEPVV